MAQRLRKSDAYVYIISNKSHRLYDRLVYMEATNDLAMAIRRERQIKKREQQIGAGRRMMATSWFNIAVAYYSLSKKDEARQYAERVAGDEQFGERARDLLARLK